MAASALAALAGASRTEDSFGVVQLSQPPSLGHVVAGLADLAVLLGHFLKLPHSGTSLSRSAHLRQLLGEP